MERKKENKELREEVTKIVNLNKKYCEEIKKLKGEKEELQKAFQDKGQGWKNEGVSERKLKVGKKRENDNKRWRWRRQ